MGLGLRLRVTNTADGTVIERTFDRFPVRIGRNPLSDMQLDSPYVSQFHAVLELHGRQLMLRDLGSRNGTHLRTSGRVQPHQPIDLGSSNYEFAISVLLFQAFPAEVETSQRQPRMRGASFAVDPDAAQEGGASAETTEVARELRPYFDAYRAAWSQYFQALSVQIARLTPDQRASFLREVAAAAPSLAGEADFQRLASFAGVDVARASGAAVAREETAALQAVKELATSYVSNRTFEGAGDIVRFLTNLQAVLDVFLKSFIPLRDGYKQFETKMEIRKNTMRASQMAVGQTVETAPDPRSLAALLLDWRNPDVDGPRAIESTFADLMIHQVAMLDGVMRGVKSLLRELSPSAIEALAEKKNKGLKFGPFRFEQLWNAFSERFSDLADEEKETFGLIFGPQFVQAYKQVGTEAPGNGPTHTGPFRRYEP